MGLILTVLLTFLIIWPLMSFFPALQDLILRPLGIQSSNSASTSSRNMSQAQSQSPLNASGPEAHVHEPSPMDVVVVKIMLQQGLRLPPEVVLSVLDFAEYWPHTTAIMDRPVSVPAGRQRENRFIVSLLNCHSSAFYLKPRQAWSTNSRAAPLETSRLHKEDSL